jgi:hypothetical protein
VPAEGVALDIPAGAISSETTITVSKRSAGPEGQLGITVELGPDGLIFTHPIALSWSIPAATLPAGALSDDLTIVTETPSGWARVPSFVETEGSETEAQALLTHFSSYALIVVDQTSALYGAWGFSATDVYGYGAGSTLVRFDGTGVSSQDLGFGSSVRLFDGWGTATNDHYIVGGNASLGKVWHGGGSAWSEVAIPAGSGSATGQPLLGIDGEGGEIIAVGYGGRAVWFDGAAWSDIAYTVPGGAAGQVRRLRAAVAFGNGNAMVVGDEVALVRAGGAWTEVDMSPLFADRRFFFSGVWGNSMTDVFAVGREFDPATTLESAVIVHFDGTLWERSSTPAGPTSCEGISGNGAVVIVVGSNGSVLRSPGGASASWTTEDLCETTSSTLHDVWVGPADFAAAVGSGAVFLHSGPDCGGSGGGGGDIVLTFASVGATDCDQSWTEQGVGMIFQDLGGDCYIYHAVPKGEPPENAYLYTFTSQLTATLPGSYRRAEVVVGPIHPSVPIVAIAERGAAEVDRATAPVGGEGFETLVLESGGGFTTLIVQIAHGTLEEIRLFE